MVKEITELDFELVRKDNIALVDFFAEWCNPCQALKPVLHELSDKFGDKLKFYSLNVDEAPELCEEFRITSIPCLVILKNGKEVSRSVGFLPETALENWIKENI